MAYVKKNLSKEEKASKERIQYLIDTRCEGKQQIFADRVGIGKSSVSQYVNGSHTPNNKTALQIADAFFVTPMWVMGFDVPMRADSLDDLKKYAAPIKTLQIYGRVAAGFDRIMAQDILGEIEAVEYDPDNHFALQISGQSMEPRIRDGDIVIVRCQPDVESGEIAIVAVNGDEATCKRIKKYRDGLELIPINPSFPVQFFTYEEVEKKPVTILGKVVELRAKF